MTPMRNPQSAVTSHAPLSVQVYQILLSVCDQRLHGYAILQDIRERTHDEVQLAAGTLYAALARLKGDGWVAEVEEGDSSGEDSRRRYYEITALGSQVLAGEAARLRRAVEMAENKRVLVHGS